MGSDRDDAYDVAGLIISIIIMIVVIVLAGQSECDAEVLGILLFYGIWMTISLICELGYNCSGVKLIAGVIVFFMLMTLIITGVLMYKVINPVISVIISVSLILLVLLPSCCK